MQEGNRSTQRKPAEASMDWKPNAHTAPGLGIEPGPIVHSAGKNLNCQICEIWADNNNHKMVPILANLCCLEENLVSNCRKKNSLKAHTTCLVMK